ncbi:hypothetical protein PRIPAC_77326 [Pristionchus pacificus]|uniref:G protein-coupled receptor n=1 Tax=Pristionchus pacificus TaxID=54126 RepID=A0A2A6CMA4_PRIPA|nr:hypothetical protein PRIPAC_77326 [Pristionchus pacificus]|eukprot:PDM79228.1 G protein-coupled receptor [Pristionchus pacificus]
MVDGRLFVDSTAVISILEGPCIMISERLCSITAGYMHINMIHSNTIVCISFWYRLRILTAKGPVGRIRLQAAILLLFIPHMFQIACTCITVSPREILEATVDRFYEHNNCSIEHHVLFGFNDISELRPALIMAYLVFIPIVINTYIVRARKQLLATFNNKLNIMSTKSRAIHKSFEKVLTISTATTTIIVPPLMSINALIQFMFEFHSPGLEGLFYDSVIFPTIVNPSTTLYFVAEYRELMSFGIHIFVYLLLVVYGISVNVVTIAVILERNSKTMKYSLLLLNTSIFGLSSNLAPFCRDSFSVFLDSNTAFCVSSGPNS